MSDTIDQIIRQIKPQVMGWVSSWHSQQTILLPFVSHECLSKGITSNYFSPFSATVPKALTLVSWSQSCTVATTNDASNYWNIRIYRYTGSAAIQLAEFKTKSLAVGAWGHFTTTINAAIPVTDTHLYIYLVHSGSPGALTLAGPGVLVR
jgi:hypothetical protein